MTSHPLEFPMYRLLVIVFALGLAACGGGGGSDSTVGSFNQPASNQTALAGTEQLVNTAAATLSGNEEVPTTASSALGSGTVTIDPVTRQLTATVTINGTSASAIQIEAGAPGTQGQPVIALTETSPGNGVWHATLTLTAAQLQTLLSGNWCFNVYSPLFPAGEIRGQIVPQSGNSSSSNSSSSSSSSSSGSGGLLTGGIRRGVLISALRGSQETTPTASNATGAGAVVVTGSNRQMLAAVTTTGVKASAVTIQQGTPGTVGPALFTLSETVPGSDVWSTRATLTETQLATLQAGGWYFNVSSSAFPSGEIRGQILPPRITTAASAAASGSASTSTGTGTTGTGVIGNGTTGTGINGINGTGMTGTGSGSSTSTSNSSSSSGM